MLNTCHGSLDPGAVKLRTCCVYLLPATCPPLPPTFLPSRPHVREPRGTFPAAGCSCGPAGWRLGRDPPCPCSRSPAAAKQPRSPRGLATGKRGGDGARRSVRTWRGRRKGKSLGCCRAGPQPAAQPCVWEARRAPGLEGREAGPARRVTSPSLPGAGAGGRRGLTAAQGRDRPLHGGPAGEASPEGEGSRAEPSRRLQPAPAGRSGSPGTHRGGATGLERGAPGPKGPGKIDSINEWVDSHSRLQMTCNLVQKDVICY